MAYDDKNVTMEGVRIVFRNFSGKATQYNREGDRNFCVLLDPDVAEAMAKDGWNIKALRAREEGEPDQPYLQVKITFKGRPPRIVLISHRGRTNLDEDTVSTLDWVDVKNVDLIVRPYEWEVNKKTGITAYLKSIFITINEDELELKYADIEEVLPHSGRNEE